MKIYYFLIFAVISCSVTLMFSSDSHSEDAKYTTTASAEDSNPTPNTPPVRTASSTDRVLTDIENQLSIAVLLFGFIAFVAQSVLLWKVGYDHQAVIKLSTVTLVIIGTLFMITSGFSSEQIAPAMGLFGTIVGYLLGKETNK